MPEGIYQRVHCTAVLQVPNHIHVKSFEPALRLLDGIEVQDCLRRVLVGSVSGIDYRNGSHRGCYVCSTGHGMAHNYHVHIVGNDLDSVLKGLSFRLAGVPVVREAYNPGA